jgi:hypothetical protein
MGKCFAHTQQMQLQPWLDFLSINTLLPKQHYQSLLDQENKG